MKRIWVLLLVAAVLLAPASALATASGQAGKAAYNEGASVELTGKVQLIKESKKVKAAILILDEPADFLQLTGADGQKHDHMAATQVQVIGLKDYHGKKVRVKGTLSGANGVANARSECIIKSATTKKIPAATSVVITKKKLPGMRIGDTEQLSARVLPASAYQTLTWSTSNANVASVSDAGLVTALSTGEATITARTPSGKKATCKVAVVIPVERIEFVSFWYFFQQDTKMQLKPIIYPANATTTDLVWKSDQPEYVKVSSKGVVTTTAKARKGHAAGVDIIVKTADGTVSATCSVHYGSKKHVLNEILVPVKERTVTVGEMFGIMTEASPEPGLMRSFYSHDRSVIDYVYHNGSGTFIAKSAGSTVVDVTVGNFPIVVPVKITVVP